MRRSSTKKCAGKAMGAKIAKCAPLCNPIAKPANAKRRCVLKRRLASKRRSIGAVFGTLQQHARQQRLYAFVMTLGWSRMLYLEFTFSTDLAWWLRCHQHAFAYFGGVPREVLHDNLKTAVLARDGAGGIHWQPRYLDFAQYYGFQPRACQPYRAQTKGKVENSIKYIRGNFWPGLQLTDLAI